VETGGLSNACKVENVSFEFPTRISCSFWVFETLQNRHKSAAFHYIVQFAVLLTSLVLVCAYPTGSTESYDGAKEEASDISPASSNDIQSGRAFHPSYGRHQKSAGCNAATT
jgi:hypothetical protein